MENQDFSDNARRVNLRHVNAFHDFQLQLRDPDLGLCTFSATSEVPDGNCCPASSLHQLHLPSGTGPWSRYRLLIYGAADEGRIGQRMKSFYDSEQAIEGTTWQEILQIIGPKDTLRPEGPEYLQVMHLALASEYKDRPIRVFCHDGNGGFYVQDYTENAPADAPPLRLFFAREHYWSVEQAQGIQQGADVVRVKASIDVPRTTELGPTATPPLVETSSHRAPELQQNVVDPLQTGPRPRKGSVVTLVSLPSTRLPTAVFADESQLNEWGLRVE